MSIKGSGSSGVLKIMAGGNLRNQISEPSAVTLIICQRQVNSQEAKSSPKAPQIFRVTRITYHF
jgi:hypothetical protein